MAQEHRRSNSRALSRIRDVRPGKRIVLCEDGELIPSVISVSWHRLTGQRDLVELEQRQP